MNVLVEFLRAFIVFKNALNRADKIPPVALNSASAAGIRPKSATLQ